MKTTLTFVLLFLAGANGCESASHSTQSTATTPQRVEPPKEPPKFAEVYDSAEHTQVKWSGPFVSSEGTWVSDNPAKQDKLPSQVLIQCYKGGGRLLVGVSDAYCMVATARVIGKNVKPVPLIDVSYYPVVSWDKERIVAADSPTAPNPLCFWSQITIDRQNHIVSVTDSRKIRKDLDGLPGACTALPLSQSYHLMDSPETKTEAYLPYPRE